MLNREEVEDEDEEAAADTAAEGDMDDEEELDAFIEGDEEDEQEEDEDEEVSLLRICGHLWLVRLQHPCMLTAHVLSGCARYLRRWSPGCQEAAVLPWHPATSCTNICPVCPSEIYPA